MSGPISPLSAALAVLTNGIIPADERDAGAAAVNAGQKLAGRMDLGGNQLVYVKGIEAAEVTARKKFNRRISEFSFSFTV